MPEEMRLIQDDDSHWYVIPKSREAAFDRWCSAMEHCEEWTDKWEPIRVDGPHMVVFTGWREC